MKEIGALQDALNNLEIVVLNLLEERDDLKKEVVRLEGLFDDANDTISELEGELDDCREEQEEKGK